MSYSIYALKPRFQALLRPIVANLARAGISPNMVTAGAMLVSCALGVTLVWPGTTSVLFLLLPAWMLLRMALNAIDGMLAREHGRQTPLGAYLNELGDVVSDAALFLPFVTVAPFGWASVGLVVLLGCISEMAGSLAATVGSARRYDGPMGKSDRAVVFGALGLWYGLAGALPAGTFWIMPLVALAIGTNIINRVRAGVRAAAEIS